MPAVLKFSCMSKLSVLDFQRRRPPTAVLSQPSTALSKESTEQSKEVVHETVLSCKTHCSQCYLPISLENLITNAKHTSRFGCPFTPECIDVLRQLTDEKRAEYCRRFMESDP